MSHRTYYIAGAPSGWWVIEPAQPPDAGHAEEGGRSFDLDAKSVLHALQPPNGPKQGPGRVVIGVPATWCLCASVDATGLPRNKSGAFDQALSFRMEALLPITAEHCAFGYIGEGPQRLGIALPASPLIDLVHALEDAGHTVEAIVPRAQLAAQGWVASGEVDPDHDKAALFWHEPAHNPNSESAQLLCLEGGQPKQWRVTGSTPDSIAQQLTIQEVPGCIATSWYTPEASVNCLRRALQRIGLDDTPVHPLSDPLQAECEAAAAILNQHRSPWVNLTSGPLAPRHQWRRVRVPAWSCIAAAMLLLATCSAMLLLRADQYMQVADRYDRQSRAAFAEALPGQPIPVSPQIRLRNRLKQLRGEQGLAAGDQALNQGTPALVLLHDALTALPQAQRFAITDLRLEGDELRMNGQARSHAEADQFANALRQGSPFFVEPPDTSNLRDGGVRFTLQARYRPPADPPSLNDPSLTPAQAGSPSLADRTAKEARP